MLTIDENTGKLKITSFNNAMSLSKIYVKASLGSTTVWSDDVSHVATLEITP